MENITYFIGAGASYHSLPLMKTMNARMRAYCTFLKICKDEGLLTHSFTSQFIIDLNELIEIDTQRTSIDSYARQLAVSGSGNQIKLLRLKSILSSYIIFEQLIKPQDLVLFSDEFATRNSTESRIPLDQELQQMIRTNIDKRYITFWGNYLNETHTSLPTNLRLISWNYDMQFETAYSYIKSCSLDFAQQNLQIYPSTQKSIDINKFCLLKLNGTAGLIDGYPYNNHSNLFDLSKHNLLDNLNYLIDILDKNYYRAFSKPIFTFAWEKEVVVNESRMMAKHILDETTILVIIGYSFPSFNKEVDRQLFENFPKLRKVYYQAPQDEMEELLDKLDGINVRLRPLVKPIYNLSTFYVPNEY